MRIENRDKISINNFLRQPINREEFDELYILTLKLVELINLKISNTTFNKLDLEILDDKDGIYKQIKINLKDKFISIELCEPIKNEYFISKKIKYLNKNNIEFTKRLVKTTYPKNDIFRELALKKWRYNGEGISLKCFEELNSIDYIQELPIYSISEYKEKVKHYTKCLSKNKNQ